MSGHNITARDRVWAAIIEQEGRFQVADIRDAIDTSDRPSDETIRRVLRSATQLGVLVHQSGSPKYHRAPTGIDTTALLALGSERKMGTGLVTERDEIADIISDDRAMSLAQHGQPEGQFVPVSPSRGSQLTDREIEEFTAHEIGESAEHEYGEYVRTQVRMFEAEAGSTEWNEQVERLVEEVVAAVTPKTPDHQSILSEWVRAVAQDEADD